ncbi:MAG TPA: TetR/AcrR family transcriptional regulator [Terriglobales bacterium]|nr:TetR/AcrR family transcriptional regulator [Terriglobales bacterium]
MSSGPVTPDLPNSRAATRFDRRLSKILDHATAVFYEKGYEGASMRDLSRVTGLSLAGLYYYFESKEELLYLIQKHYFTVVVERLQKRLENVSDAEARVRAFILNHFEYFLAENYKATKVLSKEDDVLAGNLGTEVTTLKRRYYRCCADLVEALKQQKALEFNTRVAVLGLFGMMNWIYTWYKPQVDPEAGALARQVGDIFLAGVKSSVKRH